MRPGITMSLSTTSMPFFSISCSAASAFGTHRTE